MATVRTQEMEDYWNEYLHLQELSDPEDPEEEDSSPTPDEGDIEADWLREAGFDFLVNVCQEGTDDDLEFCEELLTTLTHRQAATVRKRIATLKATVKRRRHNGKLRIRDVRDVFRDDQPEVVRSRLRSQSHSPAPYGGKYREDSDTGRRIFSAPAASSSSAMTTSSLPFAADSRFSNGYSEVNRTKLGKPTADPTSFHGRHNYRGPLETYPLVCAIPSDHRPFRSTFRDVAFLRSSHRQIYDMCTCGRNMDDDSKMAVRVLSYNVRGSVRWAPTSVRDKLSLPTSPEVSRKNEKDRQRVATDTLSELGFQEVSSRLGHSEDLPEVVPIADELGRTQPTDLGPSDMRKVRSLALIELTALFDAQALSYQCRKPVKRKLKEGVVFFVPLSTMLEHDRTKVPDCRVPLVFKRLVAHLEKNGLGEEGILRLAGSVQKIEALKSEIESNFFTSPMSVENSLKSSSVHDVAAVMKHFIRDLPEPLLTYNYMDAFLQVPSIPEPLNQLKALNMLVLLMPDVHRDTLNMLLELLSKIAENEPKTKMGLQNVAMIMAPNLFPLRPPRSSKGNINEEVNLAAVSCHVSKMLILYHHVLWTVPPYLLRQVRLQTEHQLSKKAVKEQKMKRFLARKPRADTCRGKDRKEEIFQERVIKVQSPQFSWQHAIVPVDMQTTAGEVVLAVARAHGLIRSTSDCSEKNGSRRRAMSDLPPSARLSCILSSSDEDGFLQKHSLYEVGGNIGERRLNSDVHVLQVLQENPTLEWMVRCLHR